MSTEEKKESTGKIERLASSHSSSRFHQRGRDRSGRCD
jgi:hypothetical protein